MLKVVVKNNDVFIGDGSSLDLLIVGDTLNKNLPTPEEMNNAVSEAIKALFRRKINAENQFTQKDNKVDDAPKVNLDITQLDTAIQKADELIAKLKTVKLLMDCLNKD